MRWQKLFTASFEESLNLQDDKISGEFSQKAYTEGEALEKKRGKIKSTILVLVFSLLFVFGLNYLIVFVTNYAVHHLTEKSTLPISKISFLPSIIFFVGSFLWLLLIVLGKRFSQYFISQYRFHFHIVTSLIWFDIEINLMFLTFTILSLTLIGVMMFWLLIIFLAYTILHSRVISLLDLMYNEEMTKTKVDQWITKITGFVFKYGWGFVLAGLLLKFIFPSSTGVRTDWIGYIGILVVWFILDIAIIAFETYLIFPYMLQGYYKWKYPEEYREWEGKTPEEWYGEKYLKKQEERKKRNGRK